MYISEPGLFNLSGNHHVLITSFGKHQLESILEAASFHLRIKCAGLLDCLKLTGICRMTSLGLLPLLALDFVPFFQSPIWLCNQQPMLSMQSCGWPVQVLDFHPGPQGGLFRCNVPALAAGLGLWCMIVRKNHGSSCQFLH